MTESIATQNNNSSSPDSREMLWCEPPERLKHILKFESGLKNNDLPLISIAQINSHQWNDSFNSTKGSIETIGTDTTTETLLEVTDTSIGINITELYENMIQTDEAFPINLTSDKKSEGHPHGTQIVFKCLPAINGVKNTWIIVCQDGGWIGRSSKCMGIFTMN